MANLKKTLKKGHNSAMKTPTEKKKKHGSSDFSYLFHISNFKILSLIVLDRMQSVIHGCMVAHTHGQAQTILDHLQSVTHGCMHGQAQTNMPPKLL